MNRFCYLYERLGLLEIIPSQEVAMETRWTLSALIPIVKVRTLDSREARTSLSTLGVK